MIPVVDSDATDNVATQSTAASFTTMIMWFMATICINQYITSQLSSDCYTLIFVKDSIISQLEPHHDSLIDQRM